MTLKDLIVRRKKKKPVPFEPSTTLNDSEKFLLRRIIGEVNDSLDQMTFKARSEIAFNTVEVITLPGLVRKLRHL